MSHIAYYRMLKVKVPKPKLVHQSGPHDRCSCGHGGTVYSLHQLNEKKYKISKKRERCLSFSSESDEDFERILDVSQSFYRRQSNDSYERKFYDSVYSIIAKKKK